MKVIEFMKSHAVGIKYQPEKPGLGAKLIGLILLSTDLTLEGDIQRIIRGQTIATYINRISYNNPLTVKNLSFIEKNLKQAAVDLLPGVNLDAIAFACTSGSIAIGPDIVTRRLEEGQPGVPSTTPINAVIEACKTMNISKIALLTPYRDQINKPIYKYFEDNDVETTSISTFNLDSDIDVARIPIKAIIRAGLEADHEDAEAVFLSCTALRSAECIEFLEKELKKPVFTSNQVMLWHLLKLANYNKKISGFGEVLREH